MESSPSSESTNNSAIKEFPNNLWNLEGLLPCSEESATYPYPQPRD
jgi:hypothetical protein